MVRPYFGNMDDTVLMQLASGADPFSYAHAYGWRPGYGYINDFSMLVTWPAYAVANEFGALWFYAVNALVTYLIFLASAILVRHALGWTSIWSLVGFIGAGFLWPYTAELLFFPSLQEKGVILGAALLLGWTSLLKRPEKNWIVWISFAAVTLAAFSTKTHVLVYVPAAIVLLWLNSRSSSNARNQAIPIIASSVWIGLSLATAWLTFNGTYTASTKGEIGISLLFNSKFLLMLIATIAYTSFVLWNHFTQKKRNPNLIVPLVALLTIMASFLLWSMRNYYLAAFSLAIAMAVGAYVDSLNNRNLKVILAFLTIATAAAWLTFRLPEIWLTQGSIRNFLSSNVSLSLSLNYTSVAISCDEAPTHFNRYATDLGRSGLNFIAYKQADSVDFYLADSRLCPLNVEDPSQWSPFWAPAESNSYILYKRNG